MSGMGIMDFYKTATSKGFARKNMFRITQITNNVFNPINEDASTAQGSLYLYLNDGVIPSRNISTTTVAFKGFNYNVPMNASYPEAGGWTINFSCDRDYILRDMLEKWSVATYNEHTASSTTNWASCDVMLSLLKTTGTGDNNSQLVETRKYTLKGAYPTSVGAMSYNLSDAGTIATIPVTLAFTYIISESLA
jgi:hypothetical protein